MFFTSHIMEPVHVLITGAAGQIGYVLTFKIANGDLFGERQVVLHLLEQKQTMCMLDAVVMELNDCNFQKLANVIATDDVETAFKDIDVAFLMGSIPKRPNMSQEMYLERNACIFREHGQALSLYAKPTVKVLVVGQPANTNTLVALSFAKNISPANFSAMTRLDHNRVVNEVAQHLKVSYNDIHRVFVWGNRSATQVPDVSNGIYTGPKGNKQLNEMLTEKYIHDELISSLASRGNRLVGMRGASTAGSAAHAAISHMHDWMYGTKPGEIVSMAVPVPPNEPYGIKQGIVYSFPVTIDNHGNWHIVEDLPVTDFIRERMKINEDEIRKEAQIVAQYFNQ